MHAFYKNGMLRNGNTIENKLWVFKAKAYNKHFLPKCNKNELNIITLSIKTYNLKNIPCYLLF